MPLAKEKTRAPTSGIHQLIRPRRMLIHDTTAVSNHPRPRTTAAANPHARAPSGSLRVACSPIISKRLAAYAL